MTPRVRALLVGLLAHGWIAAPATAQLERTVLDPRVYRSPSGAYELYVDPSRSTGAGGASYRFIRNQAIGEEELWAGPRPWTLWEAAVTDEGLVAGYAYAQGRNGGRDDALTILLLDRSGKPMLEERSERKGVHLHHSGPEPMVSGFSVDPDTARMLVRIRGKREPGEAWWSYDLASGAPTSRIHPRASLPSTHDFGWIQAARLLPGTSWTLAQWDDGGHGAVFTLHEPDGALRWQLRWPDYYHADDKGEEDRLQREMRAGGAILAVESGGRFTLRQVAKGERVTFEAREITGPSEGLEVREIRRAPFEPPAVTRSAAPPMESLALVPSGTIRIGPEDTAPSPIREVMDSFGVGSVSDPLRLVRIHAVALGPGDRIHASDTRTGTVHVFDDKGTFLHACRPDPNDFERPLDNETLSVDESGEVMLASLRFDPTGARLGKRGLEEGGGSRWYPATGGRRWVLGRAALVLVESDGTPARTVERDVEDRWLRDLDRAASAPDGSLAVLSTDDGCVHLFSPAGEPQARLTLPPGVPGWASFAFDGARLAFGIPGGSTEAAGYVMLLERDGRMHRFDPPREAQRWTPLFPAGGRELWLFDGERRIERFTLPR